MVRKVYRRSPVGTACRFCDGLLHSAATVQRRVASRMRSRYCGGRSAKVRRRMRLSIMGPVCESHYQLKGLWKSNTEEMFEMRVAEKRSGDGRWAMVKFLYLGEQQVMVPKILS